MESDEGGDAFVHTLVCLCLCIAQHAVDWWRVESTQSLLDRRSWRSVMERDESLATMGLPLRLAPPIQSKGNAEEVSSAEVGPPGGELATRCLVLVQSVIFSEDVERW